MQLLQISKQNKKIKIVKHLNRLIISGPLGTLYFNLDNNISSKILNPIFFIKNESLNFFFNKIKAIFKSVITGYFLELTLNGIGYKCFKIDNKIALDIGYSNLVIYKPTSNVKFKNLKNKIILFSIYKEHLNNVASLLKNYAIPDSYKGKGLILKNETIKLKKKSKT